MSQLCWLQGLWLIERSGKFCRVLLGLLKGLNALQKQVDLWLNAVCPNAERRTSLIFFSFFLSSLPVFCLFLGAISPAKFMAGLASQGFLV